MNWITELPVEINEGDSKGWKTVELIATAAGEGTLRGRIELGEITNPFWCVPGLFWGDNRQDKTRMLYPKFDAEATTPKAFVSSFWQFHVSRMSQPLSACYDGERWHILEVAPYVDGGIACSLGFAFEEGCAFLTCSLPAVEEPYAHTGRDYTQPTTETIALAEGDVLRWSYRVTTLEGQRSCLLDFLADRYHAEKSKVPTIGNKVVTDCARNGLMNWHYEAPFKRFKYAVAYDRIAQQVAEATGGSLDQRQMALGWVSGWCVFEPLMDYAVKFNDATARTAVIETWESLQDTVVSPSGFWWSRITWDAQGNDNRWDGNWMDDPDTIHLRTIGDAVLRALRTLQKHGDALSFYDRLLADIHTMAKKMAEFARKDPIMPLCINANTGEVQALKGTASMIWLSIWMLLEKMGQWDDEDVILKCAEAYRLAVEEGILYGAPEDVGEAITSEDIYIAVNVYADLYEKLGRAEDLETLRASAAWLYLWRRSFTVQLSPRTLIGAYGLDSRGGDLASCKNNHLHVYGVDCEESLFKLAEWTGSERWAELAEDHWKFVSQLISLEDGHYNGYQGMVTEQFYFTDWTCLNNSVYLNGEKDDRRANWDCGPHFQNRGNMAGFSTAWCVAFVLRSALARIK